MSVLAEYQAIAMGWRRLQYSTVAFHAKKSDEQPLADFSFASWSIMKVAN